MEERKYRIVEKVGKFFIQTLYVRSAGIFKKRIVEEWRPIDIEGHTMIDWMHQTSCSPVSSLQEAQTIIQNIKKGTIIHAC